MFSLAVLRWSSSFLFSFPHLKSLQPHSLTVFPHFALQRLLRKLEELCFKITPVVTSAVLHFSPLLCHRRAASRFESISDFAHAALGEMLNLDRALAASVSKLNRSADILHATEQQLPQQQSAVAVVGGGSAKGRRTEERFVFDASVAVAAAAAAGFTWTTPAAVSAAEAVASIPAIAPSHQHHQYDSQPAHGIDTFCTALTEPASSSVLLISDLPSVLLQPDARSLALLSSEFMTAVTPLSLRLPLTPVCESAPSGSNTPTKHCQQEQPSLCVALPTPLLSSSAVCTQHISSSRSLPDRATSETSVVDFLRTLNASPCHGMVHAVHAACSPYHQQVQNPPHQPSVFEPVFAGCGPPSSSDRNTSRSTRSISCLEFSGGLNEVREELGSLRDFVGCIPNAPSRVAVSAGKSDAVAAAAVMVAAASPANAPFTKISNVTDGMMPDGRGRTPKPQLDAAGTTPDKTPSNCCSAYGCLADGYLIDSGFVEEEVTAHWQGSGGGMMTSPSAWCSMNMESRDMRRGAPLEPSLGAVGSGAVALAAAPAPTTRPTFANLTAACGSSCATTYTISDVNSGSTNTTTTFGFVRSSCLTANTALCGTINAHLSDGVGVSAVVEGDCGEVRTSLHGLAKSRWSRESAAAAAAVWNNEAAEAFADALDFTSVSPAAGECLSRMHRAEGGSSIPALDEDDDDESGIPLMSSYWTARATEPPTPAMVSFPPRRLEQRTAAPALGGLYGIRESGSMSSVHSSLEFSDSDDDDGGVMVLNLVSNGGGGGSAVMLSSGLGAEAFRRQHCEVRGSSGCGGGSTDSQPMSKSGISVILASSYNKAGVVGTTAERVAVCG